jgi:hypothetical protein
MNFNPADYQVSAAEYRNMKGVQVAKYDLPGTASDATSEKVSDRGPDPSQWTYDSSGRLLNVPGRLEAKYDESGRLNQVSIHSAGMHGTTFTDTYTLVPGEGDQKDIHAVRTKHQDGTDTIVNDRVREDVGDLFSVSPYFIQLGANGRPAGELSTEEGRQADSNSLLSGARLTMGSGEESIPMFVGPRYQKYLDGHPLPFPKSK